MSWSASQVFLFNHIYVGFIRTGTNDPRLCLTKLYENDLVENIGS